MKLAHPFLDQTVPINELKIPVLVIENPSFFSEICFDLRNQCNGNEGDSVLSENLEILSFSKKVDMIVDYTILDINNGKVIKGLYENIEKLSNGEEWYIKTQKFKVELNNFLENLFYGIDFPLNHDYDFDLSKILKAVECKFDIDQKTFTEKLIDYFSITRDFCGVKLFVLVNLKSYINEKELLDIYEYVFYNKIALLLIENQDRKRFSDVEEVIVIDQDLCEF